MNRITNNFVRLIAVILILAVSVGLTTWMINQKEAPKSIPPTQKGWLVKVDTARSVSTQLKITGQGTVEARTQIDILPQVTGRIIEVHPSFIVGGHIPAGQPLIQIDKTDYQIALASANAEISTNKAAIVTAQAEVEQVETDLTDKREDRDRLKILVERDTANKREYDKAVHAYNIAYAKKLAAESRIASAKASLERALTAKSLAEVNLKRTAVTLDFNAVVISESVALGKQVLTGIPIGKVYNPEVFDIPIPLRDETLKWIDLRNVVAQNKNAPTPQVKVTGQYAGLTCEWEGRIARISGEVDRKTRMQHLIIEVKPKLTTEDLKIKRLVPGMYVDVEIEGRPLENVFEISRDALRENRAVWLVKDNKLHIQPVEVLRKTNTTVYIGEGLKQGDTYITSPLDTVSEGMLLRIFKPETQNSSNASTKTGVTGS